MTGHLAIYSSQFLPNTIQNSKAHLKLCELNLRPLELAKRTNAPKEKSTLDNHNLARGNKRRSPWMRRVHSYQIAPIALTLFTSHLFIRRLWKGLNLGLPTKYYQNRYGQSFVCVCDNCASGSRFILLPRALGYPLS